MHRNPTELSVLDIADGGLRLVQTAPGVSARELCDRTAGKVRC
ncbi:hypothetical protein [Streptomyces sp. NBC_00344]